MSDQRVYEDFTGELRLLCLETFHIQECKCITIRCIKRLTPFRSRYFMFYTMTTQSAPHPVSPGITFACGLGSGVAASILTQPFDVLKTKMQLRTSSSENIITSSASMLKTGGFKSFFAGTTPRILRRSLMSAFSWTIFDSLLRHDAIKTSK